MKKNENNNGHYRDCGAITDNLSRFFNLIRRSLEFFAFAKNRDDSLLFLASPRTRFSEIATSAFRLLAKTPVTLALAAVLSTSIASESHAAISCVFSDGGKTVTITGTGNDTVGWNACQANNSTSADSGWTFDSNYRKTITSANIGSGIESIGSMAFYQAANLTSITIPEGVTSIGDSAFGYSGLTSITLPDSLSSIGNNTFQGSQNLNSIKIPKNVESIGQYAFAGASGLTDVTFAGNSKIKTLERGVLQGTGITSISIPGSVEEIKYEAFRGTGLTSVVIPEGVETLTWYAFYDDNLTSIQLPSTLKNLNGSWDMRSLTTLIIPDTLTADTVADWSDYAFHSLGDRIQNVTCVKDDGSEGGDESACIKALERFFPDESGKCSLGYRNQCLQYVQKIGNTCVGAYIGSVSGDGTCTVASLCKAYGNYINSDERQCMTPESCTGMYVADTVNKKCFKMPGCVNFADGACQECDNGYLTNSSGACIPADDCKNGLHADGGACVENPAGCNTFENDHCTECNGGLLRQGAGCVSSCGEGYKLSNGACYRTHYTPAEAETVSGDTNTITLIYK